MREIKFRALDKASKRMLYGGFVNFSTPLLDASISLDGMQQHVRTAHPSREYELMQFTGLRDAAGKDIYEGDVVEYDDNRIGRAQVRWKECYFELLFPSGNVNFITTDRIRNHSIKIIGNIYENPDLLTKSTQ